MKKISTILLLFIILLQTFSAVLVRADYLFNKDFIASVLCINKAKKDNSCKGKCYLAKKLGEQKQDEESPRQKKESFEIQFYCLPAEAGLMDVEEQHSTLFAFNCIEFLSASLAPVFHPPAA